MEKDNLNFTSSSELSKSLTNDLAQSRRYFHVITDNNYKKKTRLDVIVGNEVEPELDYHTFMTKDHALAGLIQQHAKSVENTTRNKERFNARKIIVNRYVSKNAEFPKLKLERKNCIDLDNVSSDNSLNEILQDYKVDKVDSHYNHKTDPVLRQVLKQPFLTDKAQKKLGKSFEISQKVANKGHIDTLSSKPDSSRNLVALKVKKRIKLRRLEDVCRKYKPGIKYSKGSDLDRAFKSTQDVDSVEYQGQKLSDIKDVLPYINFDLKMLKRTVMNTHEPKLDVTSIRPPIEHWRSSFGDKLL